MEQLSSCDIDPIPVLLCINCNAEVFFCQLFCRSPCILLNGSLYPPFIAYVYLFAFFLLSCETFPSFLLCAHFLGHQKFSMQILTCIQNIFTSMFFSVFSELLRTYFKFPFCKFKLLKLHEFTLFCFTVYNSSIFWLNLIHNHPLVYSPSPGCRCITSQRGLIRRQ